jgi:hypothetical protein
MSKKIISSVLILLVIALVFFSGCTGSVAGESSAGDLHARYEYRDDVSVGLGCYERVSGYVYNAGTAPADAVRLNFNLVNTKTGTIRDSRSVYIGIIGPQESRTFETALDGECTGDFRVEFSFVK